MIIKTSDDKLIKNVFNKLTIPSRDSHKGQNGKVLIIGGSALFHAASLWAAEVASHLTDMVHYSSTRENEKIFFELKKIFRNGIIVTLSELDHYVNEDNAILVGPGMVRKTQKLNLKSQIDLSKIKNEADYTRELTFYLIDHFPDKKFVFDAGSLQMMDRDWLLKLHTPAILTPHQKEFEELFGINLTDKKVEEKSAIVSVTAKKFKSVILLKAVVDIISDGESTYIIEGGNAGLTKGGTGDVLSGLTVSFFAKNKGVESALMASILLKKTAETLALKSGYWYNVNDIIKKIPEVLLSLTH